MKVFNWICGSLLAGLFGILALTLLSQPDAIYSHGGMDESPDRLAIISPDRPQPNVIYPHGEASQGNSAYVETIIYPHGGAPEAMFLHNGLSVVYPRGGAPDALSLHNKPTIVYPYGG